MNMHSKLVKRIGGVVLASAVVCGSVFGIRYLANQTMTTEAAGDVTEALSGIRSRYIESADDAYRVTELVSAANNPAVAWNAEYLNAGNEAALEQYFSDALGGDEYFGYFVDGQEPFPSVYDPVSHTYQKWTDVLVSYTDENARSAFVARLCAEASYVLNSKFDGVVKPYAVAPYTEITAEAYDQLSENDKAAYRVASSQDQDVSGFMKANVDTTGSESYTGNWTVTFQRLTDGNVSLSELKTGEGKVFYIATKQTEYDYQELYDRSIDESLSGDLLYVKRSGAFSYSGTYQAAWDSVKSLFYVDDSGVVHSILDKVIDTNTGLTYLDQISGNDDFDPADYPNVTDGSGYYSVVFTHTNFNCDENGDGLTIDTSVNTVVYEMSSAQFTRGAGNYNMELSDQFGDVITVPGQFVYFQGGISSFDLFRNQIMLLETELERKAFRVVVSSYTPAQIVALQPDVKMQLLSLEGTDMLAIAGGRYSAANDLDAEVAKMMAMLVGKADIPVTVDLAEFYNHSTAGYERVASGATNLINLVDFLMLPSAKIGTTHARSTICDGNSVYSGFDTLYKNTSVINYLNNEEHPDYNDKNMNFVNNSIWFYHSSNMDPYVSRALTGEYFEENGQPGFGGYVAVYEDLVLENRTRAADISYGSARLTEKVDDAAVFRYIISYRYKRAENVKSTIRVLDIEPFYGYEDAAPANGSNFLTAETVSRWTGLPKNQIIIYSMQMNEFIGKIDDLNASYDLIYFGASTYGAGSTANKDKTIYTSKRTDGNWNSTTRTVSAPTYNDGNMRGLFYCHTGDSVKDDKIVAGLLATDYTNDTIDTNNGTLDSTMLTRSSGNDLTTEKYNALIDYLKGAYPIVFADTLLTIGSDGQALLDAPKTVADSDFVDSSSYLYEFINFAFTNYGSMCFSSGYLNTLAGESRTNRNLVYYVNRAKLNVIGTDATNPSKIDTSNQFYSYRNTAGNTLANNNLVTVLNPTKDAEGNDVFTLQYAFRIENRGQVTAGQTYSVALYLDSNNDGKFSETNEELTGLTVTRGDAYVDSNSLQSGVNYTVTRQIPANYNGCITWDLVVRQSNNPYIRTDNKGYTKLNNGNKQTINIIQICMRNGGSDLNVWPRNRINLKDEFAAGSNTNFKKAYDLISNDYEINVTFFDMQQFNDLLASSPNDARLNPDQYHMLVLGFSDSVPNKDFSEDAIQWVINFIQSGKSAILGHDMTGVLNTTWRNICRNGRGNNVTGNNYTGNGTQGVMYMYGFQMNNRTRSLVGMDTYGVTTANVTPTSNLRFLLNNPVLTRATDGALKDSQGNVLPEPTKNGEYYNYDTTYDIAYAPNTGRASTVNGLHGFSTNVVYSVMADNYSTVNYRSGYSTSAHGSRGNRESTKIDQINEGQITTYPFVIGEEIGIATTHDQWYALNYNTDMDTDGETDIVVWYTLGHSNHYNSDPYDVKNNYYMYSIGNVLYTGMGHTGPVTLDEAKLFMNVFIAAYKATEQLPEINTFDETGITTDVFYGYYDGVLADESVALTNLDEMVDVSLQVQDFNMITGTKKVILRMFSQDDAGTVGYLQNKTNSGVIPAANANVTGKTYTPISSSGEKVRDVTGESSVIVKDAHSNKVSPTTRDGVTCYELQIGAKYTVSIPIEYLYKNNTWKRQFYIAAYNTTLRKTILGTDIQYDTDWKVHPVTYTRVELFDLH